MRTRRALVAVAVVATSLFTGVASAWSAPAMAAGSTAATTPVPTCTVITQADTGKTFSMTLQSCDLLELTDTNGIRWSTPTVNGNSIVLEPLPIASAIAGQFWRIQPVALGTSTITSLGYPICTTPPCPQYVVLFQVKIVVLPSP